MLTDERSGQGVRPSRRKNNESARARDYETPTRDDTGVSSLELRRFYEQVRWRTRAVYYDHVMLFRGEGLDRNAGISALTMADRRRTAPPSDSSPAMTDTPVLPEDPTVETLLGWSLVHWKELANERAVKKGLDWFRTHRVTHVNLHGDGLSADLCDGAKGEKACWVTVRVDDAYSASIQYGPDADAPFEEQWGAAIAAVLAYQASQPVDERVMASLGNQMRHERAKRARHGVDVEPPAHGIWGTWHAKSVDRRGPAAAPYRVYLRALDDDINGCTCPDFMNNQLGTCKHIEAVRLRVGDGKGQGSHPLVTPYLRVDGSEVPGVQIPTARAAAFEPLIAAWSDGFSAQIIDGVNGVQRVEWPGLPIETFLQTVTGWASITEVSIGPDLHARMEQMADQRLRATQAATRRGELAGLSETPPFLSVRLYPYQVEGIRHLAGLGRAILADDMGLGKTLQAIGAMRFLMVRGDVKTTLVVAPTSLMGQWQMEIEKFTGLPSTIITGSAVERAALLRTRPAIAITSYDRMIRDFGSIRHDYRPDLVIADEAQRFKNWQTRAAAFIKAIDAPFRFALTGTPMENRLLELYSVVQFVDPTILGAMWRFVQEYHVTDLRGEPVRPRNVGALRERLSGVLLRRERSLVADQLPERQDIRLLAPLDPAQRDHHDGALTVIERLGAIMRKRPLNPVEQRRLQSAIVFARMACDCAGLIDKKTLTSPKLELYAELIEQLCVEAGKKVVVFSQWIRMGELAVMHAENVGVRALQLHGGVSADRRPALLKEFATNPDIGVLVCSDAGSTGLNLQMATALIHLDMPWTPAIHDQRSARIFRLGQKSDVLVYTLLGEDSYELHVENTVLRKARLFSAAVGDGDASAYDEVAIASENEQDTIASIATRFDEELQSSVDSGVTDEQSDSEADLYDDTDDELAYEDEEEVSTDSPATTTAPVGLNPDAVGQSAAQRARVPDAAAAEPSRPSAGRPRWAAEVSARGQQLERVAAATRVPAEALWRAGKRRFATEMLVRGESLKACASVGDALPPSWEELTEWWQLRAAAGGLVSVERASVFAQASALLALPHDLFTDVVDDTFWEGLLG